MEIAHYFSVSRTPVREAALLLAQQGLVEIIPSRGTKASRAKADKAFSIYEALSEIAGSAAWLACQKQKPGDLKELRRTAYLSCLSL
jgi:DNA-binding GntR family transcriptional regulator